jgi:hypothetical protein
VLPQQAARQKSQISRKAKVKRALRSLNSLLLLTQYKPVDIDDITGFII